MPTKTEQAFVNKKKVGMRKKCPQCGDEFPSLSWNHKYCSPKCSKAFQDVKYKERNPNTLKGNSGSTTGALSELRVAVDLMSKGYNVFRALSPASPCDLVVLKNSKVLRIEVTTTYVSLTGKPYNVKNKKDDPTIIDHYAWVMPNEIQYEPLLK